MKNRLLKNKSLLAKRHKKAVNREEVKKKRIQKTVRYFETLDNEERSLISKKGVLARITPEVIKAWNDKQQLTFRRIAGENVKDLADEYKISVRTMYRITSTKEKKSEH